MNDLVGDWKKLRKTVLSSGLPLEQVTVRELMRQGYGDGGESTVAREGKFFSIDVAASKSITTPKKGGVRFSIEPLVECKYLRPPKALVFASFAERLKKKSSRGGAPMPVAVSGVESLLQKEVVPFSAEADAIIRLRLLDAPRPALECHKGALIAAQESPDIFRELQFQLTFPVIDSLISIIRRRFMAASRVWPKPAEWKHPLPWASFMGPLTFMPVVVVTNAPLLTLNDDVGLQELEQSRQASDVMTLQRWVRLSMGVPGESERFLEERMGALRAEIRSWEGESSTSFGWDVGALEMMRSSTLRVTFVSLPALPDFIRAQENSIRAAVARFRREFVPDPPSAPRPGFMKFGSIA